MLDEIAKTSIIQLLQATAAAEGCAVMLNGLGNANEIEETRRGLIHETGAAADYDGADMPDALAIATMVDAARAMPAAASITDAALPIEGGWTAQ